MANNQKYIKGTYFLRGREKNFQVEGYLTIIIVNNKEYKIILNKNGNKWNSSEYYTGCTFSCLNTSSREKIMAETLERLTNTWRVIDGFIEKDFKNNTMANK